MDNRLVLDGIYCSMYSVFLSAMAAEAVGVQLQLAK